MIIFKSIYFDHFYKRKSFLKAVGEVLKLSFGLKPYKFNQVILILISETLTHKRITLESRNISLLCNLKKLISISGITDL